MSITSNSRLPHRTSRARRYGAGVARALIVMLGLSGTIASCSPSRLLGDQQLPPDVPDPAEAKTPLGAVKSYRGALLELRVAVASDFGFIPVTGLFTDELQYGALGLQGSTADGMLIDSRFLPEDPGLGNDLTTTYPVTQTYGLLQRTRGQSRQARGALAAYAPDSSTALIGHLFAVEGYADVMLADLFCSGVPLSTVDFGGDFTYEPGSSTQEVYQRATALFDSALAMSADSERVMDLARIGKGRALLAIGDYAGAASAVSSVSTAYQYLLTFDLSTTQGPSNSTVPNQNFVFDDFDAIGNYLALTMVNREGTNGLPFMSSGDPRSAWVDLGSNPYGRPKSMPAKYAADGTTPIVLASGIEARLIEAEAALAAGDASWLTRLNALRTDGTFDTQPDTINPAATDTLWHAGAGGVAGLAPLGDPESAAARVDLVFSERAYWLFLTGHRQGDLRRLVREYTRQQSTVYPVGQYPGAHNVYGSEVNAPIPGDERVSNPRYAGCRGRGA